MAREKWKLTPPAFQRLLAAVGVVALGGALLVWNQQRAEPGVGQAQAPFPGPAVPAERLGAGPTPGASTVLAVTLAPGLHPDPTRINPPVNVGAGVQTLRLVLEVEHRPGDALYRVIIETPEHRRVWSLDGLERMPAANPTMTVEAPSSAFAAGDYIVLLQAAGPGSSRFHDAHEYLLPVRRSR